MAKTCPNCGMKQPNSTFEFCVFCGTNLKTGERTNAQEIEEIEKSKALKNSKSSENNNLEDYVPKAPVIPEPPKKQTVVYKSSVVGAEKPAVNNSNQQKPAFKSSVVSSATPDKNNSNQQKPVYKSSVVNSATPDTNNSAQQEPVYKSSVVSSATPDTNNSNQQKPVYKSSVVAPAQPPASNGFKTGSLGKPSIPEAFETGILEEEITGASPVQTISEVKQELPKPNKNISQPAAKSRVSSYIGLDLKTAELMIQKTGFKSQIIKQNSDTIAKNEVISQSVPANSEADAGTVIKLFVSCGSWSRWSEKEPDSNGKEIESRTEYRTRTREKKVEKKTSKSSDNMEGYTLCDSKKGYGDWVTEPYFTNASKKTSEICELVDNLIGFKYCGWFYKGKEKLSVNSFSTLESALYFNKNTKKEDWEYCETVSYNNVKENVSAWTPASESEMPETPAGDKICANIRMITYRVDGKEYPLKYGSFETQWYKYKNRSMSGVTYYFEKDGYTNWSEWSNWSEKSDVQTEFKEVESRVVYRYREKSDM